MKPKEIFNIPCKIQSLNTINNFKVLTKVRFKFKVGKKIKIATNNKFFKTNSYNQPKASPKFKMQKSKV